VKKPYRAILSLAVLGTLGACVPVEETATSHSSIYGAAPSGATPVPGDAIRSKEYQDLMVGTTAGIMKEKLRQNGAKIFCDQKSYLGCYDIPRAQCLAELSPLAEPCMARTDTKYSRPTNADEMDQYAQYFGVCLISGHLRVHVKDDVSRIGECMKNMRFDTEQRNKSLLQ
jgi:hypothetical protein